MLSAARCFTVLIGIAVDHVDKGLGSKGVGAGRVMLLAQSIDPGQGILVLAKAAVNPEHLAQALGSLGGNRPAMSQYGDRFVRCCQFFVQDTGSGKEIVLVLMLECRFAIFLACVLVLFELAEKIGGLLVVFQILIERDRLRPESSPFETFGGVQWAFQAFPIDDGRFAPVPAPMPMRWLPHRNRRAVRHRCKQLGGGGQAASRGLPDHDRVL